MESSGQQCRALSAGGRRCTRRVNKASDAGLCGTHMRGTPHGTLAGEATGVTDKATPSVSKIEVRVQEVCGINYYVDDAGNVYDPRDVVGRRPQPRVVGRWVQGESGRYRIPELGIEDPAEITA